MSDKKNSFFIHLVRRVVLLLLALAAVVLYAWCMWIYADTLMPLWIPIASAAVIAGVTALFYVDSLNCIVPGKSRMLNVLWHVFLMGAVGAFIVLGGNYYGAMKNTEYTDTVTVVNRFTETHDTYRRIGRHHRVKNGTRTDYKIIIMCPHDISRKRPVSIEKYNKVKVGDTYSVTMRRGLLGYPVMVDSPL